MHDYYCESLNMNFAMASMTLRHSCTLSVAILLVLSGCSAKKGDSQSSVRDTITSAAVIQTDTLQASYQKELDLNTYLVHQRVDTSEVLAVDSTCIIELPPTEKEHEEAIKDSTEEDFTTAADDYYYYASLVSERADSLHIKVVQTIRRYLRFVVNDSLSLLVDTKISGSRSWNAFLFKRGTAPVVFGLVEDPDTRKIERYFNPNR
jgi:hypothetical protein